MISRFNPPNQKPRIVRVRGSSGSTEQKVGVSQKDCAYIGFSSFERWPSKSSPLYHYSACLLKSIIKKHTGVDVESHGQYMGAFLGTTYRNDWSVGGTSYAMVAPTVINKIEFIRKYQRNEDLGSVNCYTDVAFTVDVFPTLTKTFHEMATEIAKGLLIHFAARPTANNNSDLAAAPELYGYHVVSIMDMHQTTKDGDTHATYYRHPIVRLDNQKVSIRCDTFIRVQNMTTGTNGNDTGLLGQNPLVMRMYHFKDPYPCIRRINLYNRQVPTNADGHTGDSYGSLLGLGGYQASALMCDINGDGIINIGARTAGIQGWERLPTSDMFTNLARVGRDRMNPDEIKYHRMKFKFYGYINRFFKGYIGASVSSESGETETKPAVMMLPNESNNVLGTHDMFAFQHYMPDPSVATMDSIELHVLVKRYTNVSLGPRLRKNMLPYRQDQWGGENTTIEATVVPAGYEPAPAGAIPKDDATADNDMMKDSVMI